MKYNNVEIIRADEMGFCSGVQDAVKLAEKLCQEYSYTNIFMLGMLVHNEQVIKDLNDIGIKIISEEQVTTKEINVKKTDVVIVRAHGTTKEIYMLLEETGAKIYDAACVFVKRIRRIMEKKIKDGFEIIFLGDKNHPEVKGIISHGDNIKVFSNVKSLEEAKLNKNKKYFFMAQTTLNIMLYNEIKSYIENNFKNSQIGNTICGATHVRQKAVEKLAKETDLVLVVGGRNSSNTKKLYEISKLYNHNSYLIEDYRELHMIDFGDFNKIGITAGASTPEKSIIEIERIIKGEVL